jgi:glycine/D-amino acid oxidase-like deaminating enzyme
LPPFFQRTLPVLLAPVSIVDVAFEIKVIVDGGMDGGELLLTSHSAESEHRPLTPAKRQVTVLSPVGEPPPDILTIFVSDDFHGSTIRLQAIGHYDLWIAISVHRFG